MREQACSKCGFRFPLNSLFEVNGRVLCEKCGDPVYAELSQNNQPVTVKRKVDPSICAKCESDAGSGEYAIAAGSPYCPACTEALYNRKFPAWLVGSMALLLVLLCVALVQSRKYFSGARDLYRAERLVNEKKYQEAMELLKPAVELAPECDKCALLFAKAAILSGEPGPAFKTLDAHRGGKFENGRDPLFLEVKALSERIYHAVELNNEATKKADAKDYDGAVQDLRKAQVIYPEWTALADGISALQVGPAFDAKDWDRFLKLTEESYQRNPNSPMSSASMASALACKFVSTNDDQYKQRAIEMLAKAKSLAKNAHDRADYQEYAERIQHRLDAKVIIDKDEYDRRFRNGGKAVTK